MIFLQDQRSEREMILSVAEGTEACKERKRMDKENIYMKRKRKSDGDIAELFAKGNQ